jgi:hypothetical protein
MQVPSWPVVRFADLEPGSCFLDEDSYGRQISVAVAMEEKVGGKEPFGWIDLFSENPQKSPGVLMGAARESVGHALHLDGADVDFEEASDNLLGSGLIQTQNAMMAARTTADKKLRASLS